DPGQATDDLRDQLLWKLRVASQGFRLTTAPVRLSTRNSKPGARDVKLPRRFYDELVAHAESEPEQEVCGLVAGKDGVAERVYRTRNVAKTPAKLFQLHPK